MTIADKRLESLNGRDALPSAWEDAFEPLLDSNEAAALLKIHPKTIQKMARNGEISAIHIGKLWRFRASALNEWLEKIAG